MYKKNVNEELKKYDVNDLKAMNKLLMDLRQSDEEDVGKVLGEIKKVKKACIVCSVICAICVVIIFVFMVLGTSVNYETAETTETTTTEYTNEQTVEGDNATQNNVSGNQYNGTNE